MYRLSCLFLISSLIMAPAVFAEPLAVNQGDSIHSILSAHQGKRVTIQLTSGSELTGKVGTVNTNVVQLMELSDKEFFDAVASIDEIEAVVIRTRK